LTTKVILVGVNDSSTIGLVEPSEDNVESEATSEAAPVSENVLIEKAEVVITNEPLADASLDADTNDLDIDCPTPPAELVANEEVPTKDDNVKEEASFDVVEAQAESTNEIAEENFILITTNNNATDSTEGAVTDEEIVENNETDAEPIIDSVTTDNLSMPDQTTLVPKPSLFEERRPSADLHKVFYRSTEVVPEVVTASPETDEKEKSSSSSSSSSSSDKSKKDDANVVGVEKTAAPTEEQLPKEAAEKELEAGSPRQEHYISFSEMTESAQQNAKDGDKPAKKTERLNGHFNLYVSIGSNKQVRYETKSDQVVTAETQPVQVTTNAEDIVEEKPANDDSETPVGTEPVEEKTLKLDRQSSNDKPLYLRVIDETPASQPINEETTSPKSTDTTMPPTVSGPLKAYEEWILVNCSQPEVEAFLNLMWDHSVRMEKVAKNSGCTNI
jgi:hypothetical protein